MRCPKLDSGRPEAICRLRTGVYAPTSEQMAEFCTTLRYLRCPLYRRDLDEFLRACRVEAERAVG
ncbi:MAG: hypothetical protein ABIO65_04385 [Nitrospiria bacterium]